MAVLQREKRRNDTNQQCRNTCNNCVYLHSSVIYKQNLSLYMAANQIALTTTLHPLNGLFPGQPG